MSFSSLSLSLYLYVLTLYPSISSLLFFYLFSYLLLYISLSSHPIIPIYSSFYLSTLFPAIYPNISLSPSFYLSFFLCPYSSIYSLSLTLSLAVFYHPPISLSLSFPLSLSSSFALLCPLVFVHYPNPFFYLSLLFQSHTLSLSLSLYPTTASVCLYVTHTQFLSYIHKVFLIAINKTEFVRSKQIGLRVSFTFRGTCLECVTFNMMRTASFGDAAVETLSMYMKPISDYLIPISTFKPQS